MGFKSGYGDCWWTGERERQIWTWQTQFWVFRSKPSLGSLEANLVLRLFMLLRFPTVHSFGLLEKPSYVGGSLLWCAYDYIASCWTVLEVSAFLKFLSNFLPFLHNDIFWSCFLLILYEFFVLGGERYKRKAKIHIYPRILIEVGNEVLTKRTPGQSVKFWTTSRQNENGPNHRCVYYNYP